MGATSDARITPRNRNNHNNAAGSSSHSTTETSTTTTTLDTTTDHHTKPMNVDHPPLRYFGDENENDNYNGVGDSPSKYHRSPKSSNNLLRVMSDNQKQAVILLVLSAIIYAACQFDNTFSLLVIPEDVEGPKPGTHIAMIALLGERNSGTRWTSRYVQLERRLQHRTPHTVGNEPRTETSVLQRSMFSHPVPSIYFSHLVDCFNSSIEVGFGEDSRSFHVRDVVISFLTCLKLTCLSFHCRSEPN